MKSHLLACLLLFGSHSPFAWGATPQVRLRLELDVAALSSLVDLWDFEALQKQTGLTGNLRLRDVDGYLTQPRQLKGFPESVVQELTEGKEPPALDSPRWTEVEKRWRALPLETRLPLLTLTDFGPAERAAALHWAVAHGFAFPPWKDESQEELKPWREKLKWTWTDGAVVASREVDVEAWDTLKELLGKLRETGGPSLTVHFDVKTPERDDTERAELFRLRQRLESGSFSLRPRGPGWVEGADEKDVEGWLAVLQQEPATASEEMKASVRKILTEDFIRGAAALAEDPEVPLADVRELLAFLAPWPNFFPETDPLVKAVARAVQNRLRPWRILQMGPGTDVLTVLSLIRESAQLLPEPDRKITFRHAAFPVAIEYQMQPPPEVLGQALAWLASENPRARQAVLVRLESEDEQVLGSLLPHLENIPATDAEFVTAVSEARDRWYEMRQPLRLPAAEPKVEPPAPFPSDPCTVSLRSLIPENL